MNNNKDLEKLKESLKMRIIICGNKIEKEVLDIILKDNKNEFYSIDINNNDEYKVSRFTELNWDLYEFEDGYNEKIGVKIYEIIHKNFGIKKSEKHSVLIFFTGEDNDDTSILEFFDEKNSYFHPFILFITSNNKKDKLYYQNFIKENEIDFDERNIEVFQKDSKNIKELIFKKLWKICCYYNEIGDDIVIPELELIGPKKELNLKFSNCLNFFITGKPGAGKSTLVNVICNEKKAKESIGGGSITSRIVKYFIGDSPIALYDTPGFNSKSDIEKLIEKIKKKMDEIYDIKEQIHGIFYIIDAKSTRTLDEGELSLIKFIIKCEIPLFFLLNFSKYNNSKKNNYLESLLIILEKEYPKSEITKKIYLINLKNDYEGNIIFGLDKFFQDLYNYYYPYKINLDEIDKYFSKDLESESNNEVIKVFNQSILFKNISKLEDILKNCRKKANDIIKASSLFSFLGGLIPFGNVGVSGIQLILFSSILTIYGYNLNKIEIYDAFTSFGITSLSAASNYALGFICNIMLVIPLFGYLVGSFIKAGVGLGTTYLLGNKCIEYCEKNFKFQNVKDFYTKFASNYNDAIDNLFKLSEFFKRNDN